MWLSGCTDLDKHIYEARPEVSDSMAGNGKSAAAIFDFDGTLSKGNLSLALVEHLAANGLFNPDVHGKFAEAIRQFKSSKLSEAEFYERCGVLWAEGIKGLQAALVEGASRDLFLKLKGNIYPESYELVSLMKSKGYHTIMISIGAVEVNRFVAEALGIDRLFGTAVEVGGDGRYTGTLTTSVHLPDGKGRIMDQLWAEYNFAMSFGFGDSIPDSFMLEWVGHAVVVNPFSREMEEFAARKGWPVCTSKDVVAVTGLELDKVRRPKSLKM